MVYIAVSGIDCEGCYILGVYKNKDDARKVIQEKLSDYDFMSVKKISEDNYEISGYRYLAVLEHKIL